LDRGIRDAVGSGDGEVEVDEGLLNDGEIGDVSWTERREFCECRRSRVGRCRGSVNEGKFDRSSSNHVVSPSIDSECELRAKEHERG